MNKVANIRDITSHGSAFGRSVVDGVANEVCPEPVLPIVMIMAKGDDVDHQLRELARRIEAALEPRKAAAILEVGELRIDRAAHRVTVAGEEIRLTSIEYRLLVRLAERSEATQARPSLLREVWELNALNRTRTIDTHVKRLRDKLKSAGRFIQTVRGVGYRFSDRSTGAYW